MTEPWAVAPAALRSLGMREAPPALRVATTASPCLASTVGARVRDDVGTAAVVEVVVEESARDLPTLTALFSPCAIAVAAAAAGGSFVMRRESGLASTARRTEGASAAATTFTVALRGTSDGGVKPAEGSSCTWVTDGATMLLPALSPPRDGAGARTAPTVDVVAASRPADVEVSRRRWRGGVASGVPAVDFR